MALPVMLEKGVEGRGRGRGSFGSGGGSGGLGGFLLVAAGEERGGQQDRGKAVFHGCKVRRKADLQRAAPARYALANGTAWTTKRGGKNVPDAHERRHQSGCEQGNAAATG